MIKDVAFEPYSGFVKVKRSSRFRARALLMTVFASWNVLVAQGAILRRVTVQPGKVAEIDLPVWTPQPGRAFDILCSFANASVTLALPDGSLWVSDTTKDEGPVLEPLTADETSEIDDGIKQLMAPGPGKHWLLAFRENSQPGYYRIRVDGTQARSPFRVVIATVSLADAVTSTLRRIPGARIFERVKVPVGPIGAKMAFTVSRKIGDVEIDVATEDPRTLILLRLPNGVIVTPENARAHGIDWGLRKWSEELAYDDFGFGVMFSMMTMAPLRGMHHSIVVYNETAVLGRYTIEAIAVGGKQTSVTAMVMPAANGDE